MTTGGMMPTTSAGYDIYMIRGVTGRAGGFGVETKFPNRAVMRNPEKFGPEHVFQLTPDENDALRFQSGISNAGHGGSSVR